MPFEYQPILSGDLIKLRPIHKEDFPALYAVASDPLIWQQHPASDRHEKSVFRSFFDEALRSGGALVACDKNDDQIIGSSRYHAYNESASEVEIGWTFLARTYWGGEYNGEMKRLMLNHAFRFVDSVVLLVGPDNIRSQRAVEKIGAKRDGSRTDGTGLESYLFRIRRSDVRK